MPTQSYAGFLGPSYQSQSYMADSERCVNWYLEKNESPNAPTPFALMPCPGFTVFASVPQAPIRGEFYQNGRAFFVAGFAFYELFADGTTTQRGTVNADAHPVTIHANGDAGNQLWITSGGVGYVFDLTSNLLTVEGVPGTTVSMGGFLSARFLYLDALTGAFYASALYDGTTWNPTFVAQSESGNPWRTLVVTPDDLIHLIGEFSAEVWADQGASPFPFTKIREASSPYGIVAPFAWALDTQLTFVAQNEQGRGMICRYQGYTPNRISTHAIEATLGTVEDFSAVTGFSYQELGHHFALFTVPPLEQTWVFDAASTFWHERAYWDTDTGVYTAYRPGVMMSAFGKNIVGDRISGDLYELSIAVHTDVDGSLIRRLRQPPRFSIEQKRVIVHSIQVVLDTGLGLVTGQGSDPKLMLQTARDGGKVFGNERWASAGKIGAYPTRVLWERCGQSRNRVDRFVATDPIPWRIVDCVVNFSVGT